MSVRALTLLATQQTYSNIVYGNKSCRSVETCFYEVVVHSIFIQIDKICYMNEYFCTAFVGAVGYLSWMWQWERPF